MPSLTIKGISDALLEELRRSAVRHRRSLNSEALEILERSVAPSPIDPEAFLGRIGRLQDRAPLPPLTDALLEEAIGEGRA
jgi:hypothetical protein